MPVNPEQSENALFPIVVIELGNVKVPLNPVQPENALYSIDFIELGYQ